MNNHQVFSQSIFKMQMYIIIKYQYSMDDQVAYRVIGKRLFRLPTEITLVSASNSQQYIPQDQIAQLCLSNQKIIYIHRKYTYDRTQFGIIPNLILKTKVYTRYQLLQPLCQIEYQHFGIQKQSQAKTFILDFSKSINEVLSFYKHHTSLFLNKNHLNQTDIKKKLIEQFQLINMILLKNKKNSFDIVETNKSIPLTDIVVFCYLKSIIKIIPNSYPDYLLRTSYSSLFEWYLQKQTTVYEQVNKTKDQGKALFQEHKLQHAYVNGLRSYININPKYFGFSFLAATAIYALFVE